jgi:hypothetical protein
MTGLEQLHQRKRDDETDSGPFQASQNGVKHPGPTVAQATAALKRQRLGRLEIFGPVTAPLFLALPRANLQSFAVFLRRKRVGRWKCVDCDPAVCLHWLHD